MTIQINDEFDLDKTINSGQCFRPCLVSEGYYRFIHQNSVLYIRPYADNSFEIKHSGVYNAETWDDYFDLSRNYAAARARIPADDPFMRIAGEYGKGIRILRQDPWETLISFIISQRKSIPAIRSCVEQLCSRFGEPIDTCFGTVRAFPTPERLAKASDAELRSCALGYRAPYIADAAKQVYEGTIDLESLYDHEPEFILEELKKILGVGIKVANCVLLFAYGRTAAVPIDTWIQKIIAQKYNGSDPFTASGENAGIFQQYAFYYAISHKHLFQ